MPFFEPLPPPPDPAEARPTGWAPPMNSYVEFERAGIPETMTSIDTADIIEAAKDVVVLWEHRPQSPDPS